MVVARPSPLPCVRLAT